MLTKGNIFISHLYDGTKSNKHYYYHRGWNIQALIAYICGIVFPFLGFIGTLGANVSNGATELGRLGWLLSFTFSFVFYYAICRVWPTANQKIIQELKLGWEENSDGEVVAEGEVTIFEKGRKVEARNQSESRNDVGKEEGGA
jgi:nucleobase:cation symporter-1, NCS1 family